MRGLKIIKGDFFLASHVKAIIDLINDYILDDMGGGAPLCRERQQGLILGLQKHPGTHVFLARYKKEFVGLAVCFEGFSTFEAKKLLNIHDLIVMNEYRGRGIGKKILEATEDYARANSFCRLTLEVREDNKKAQKLYLERGIGPKEAPMLFWIKELM